MKVSGTGFEGRNLLDIYVKETDNDTYEVQHMLLDMGLSWSAGQTRVMTYYVDAYIISASGNDIIMTYSNVDDGSNLTSNQELMTVDELKVFLNVKGSTDDYDYAMGII